MKVVSNLQSHQYKQACQTCNQIPAVCSPENQEGKKKQFSVTSRNALHSGVPMPSVKEIRTRKKKKSVLINVTFIRI